MSDLQDAEQLQEISSGVAECIKNADSLSFRTSICPLLPLQVGPGVLGSDEVQKLTARQELHGVRTVDRGFGDVVDVSCSLCNVLICSTSGVLGVR